MMAFLKGWIGWKFGRKTKDLNEEITRGHLLRTMGGISSGPGGLETFGRRCAWGISAVISTRLKRGTMGDEKARDVGKWGRVGLETNRKAKNSVFSCIHKQDH